jgi:hypothetical protein
MTFRRAYRAARKLVLFVVGLWRAPSPAPVPPATYDPKLDDTDPVPLTQRSRVKTGSSSRYD